jgi:GNAT superfamily N-acetyltransferase
LAKFRIIKTTDPFPYETELVRFWEENLPGTAPGRLKWFREGNPAGPTVWFLAFDEAKDVLAGTISLMPKTLLMNGRRIRSGIIGDLMVDKRYRGFGLADLLIKDVVSNLSNLGIEFLYGVPNSLSAKVLERNAFKCMMECESFVRPINLVSYLDKYLSLSSGSVKALAGFDKFIKAAMTGLQGEIKGVFNEETQINDLFDQLWDMFVRKTPRMLLGERGAGYIRWRYIDDPQYDFKVLTYRSSPGEPLSGYLVYSANGNKIEIYDLISLKSDITGKLIKKIIRIAQAGDYKAIYATLNSRMPIAGVFRRHLFINNKDKIKLYCPAGMTVQTENWYFLAGDRNL